MKDTNLIQSGIKKSTLRWLTWHRQPWKAPHLYWYSQKGLYIQVWSKGHHCTLTKNMTSHPQTQPKMASSFFTSQKVMNPQVTLPPISTPTCTWHCRGLLRQLPGLSEVLPTDSHLPHQLLSPITKHTDVHTEVVLLWSLHKISKMMVLPSKSRLPSHWTPLFYSPPRPGIPPWHHFFPPPQHHIFSPLRYHLLPSPWTCLLWGHMKCPSQSWLLTSEVVLHTSLYM